MVVLHLPAPARDSRENTGERADRQNDTLDAPLLVVEASSVVQTIPLHYKCRALCVIETLLVLSIVLVQYDGQSDTLDALQENEQCSTSFHFCMVECKSTTL